VRQKQRLRLEVERRDGAVTRPIAAASRPLTSAR